VRKLFLYRRALTELFRQLQFIAIQPFAHGSNCLPLQQELIKYITSIERKIRSRKKSSKAIRIELASRRPIPLTGDEAQRLKLKSIKLECEIAEYVALLLILRDVGDGLAFIYLDRFDIKPMAFKSQPGFLSGKAGNRLERKYLRHCFKEKKIAILNDLTNCMRYGDVTEIDEENGPTIAEVKSGGRITTRGRRQIAGFQKLVKYYREDVIDELDGFKGPIRRIALDTEESHHRDELNALIALSLESGRSSYKQVEEGLFYVVETEAGIILKEVIAQIKGTPIVANINEFKQNNIAYYPFTLSLRCPEHLFRFYAGDFVVLAVVDSDVISSSLRSQNLHITFLDDESWAVQLSKKDDEGEDWATIQISSHFWCRLAVEFLSLKWFLEEVIKISKAKILAKFDG
jgi:hypothetical protein